MLPATPTPDADAVFFKRQRTARFFALVALAIALLGTAQAQTRWPALAPWCVWFWAAECLLGFAAITWSGRCTLCGGGIKLNGRTCSRCGHVFSRIE
jgi:predicted nucleic acid-binding Zn ribbon protein